MHRLLVVASNPELTRSLRFAFEAEGYFVMAEDRIGHGRLPSDFDCTVVDHHAFEGDLERARSFCERFEPVVLLANSPGDPLAAYAFRTVLKPTLGPSLILAIHQSIRRLPI